MKKYIKLSQIYEFFSMTQSPRSFIPSQTFNSVGDLGFFWPIFPFPNVEGKFSHNQFIVTRTLDCVLFSADCSIDESYSNVIFRFALFSWKIIIKNFLWEDLSEKLIRYLRVWGSQREFCHELNPERFITNDFEGKFFAISRIKHKTFLIKEPLATRDALISGRLVKCTHIRIL